MKEIPKDQELVWRIWGEVKVIKIFLIIYVVLEIIFRFIPYM